MYSALIVDDERFMREGILRLIPWEELGFDHVETAESGDKALERVHEHMPQVLITDIEMGNMNGLCLIQEINELNPDLRIIVVTGHDNFDYMQECCRMNVHDYLLKPIEVNTLADSIRVQVKKLEEAEQERRRRNKEKVMLSLMGASVDPGFFTEDALLQQYEEAWEMILEYSGDADQQRTVWLHWIVDHYMIWSRENGNGMDNRLTELMTEAGEKDNSGLYELGKRFLDDLLRDTKRDSGDVIVQAQLYIDSHLNEELSVTSLAGRFFLSVAYFSRLFKKTTGKGCNTYIMQKRMDKAKILLKKPKIRVADVAEQVGYRDVNYFSLTFKKYTGISPAEYSAK